MWLLRFGAVCGVILGLSLGVPGVIESFTGETAVTSFIVGLGAAFGAPALTAIYLRQREESGRFGAFAYAVNVIGLGLFAGVAFSLNLVIFFLDSETAKEVLSGPTRLATLASAAVFVLGTVLFGISLVRAKVFPRLPAWGYPITLSVLALLAPLPDSVFTSAVHVLACVTMIWLSASVWRSDAAVRL